MDEMLEQAEQAELAKPEEKKPNLLSEHPFVLIVLPLLGIAATIFVVFLTGWLEKPKAFLYNPLLDQAEVALIEERFDEAIPLFEGAAKVEPDNPRIWLGKYAALELSDRREEAMEALREGESHVKKRATGGKEIRAVRVAAEGSPEDGLAEVAEVYRGFGFKEFAQKFLRLYIRVVDGVGRLAEKSSMDVATVGSILRFGKYDWLVLDIQEPYALVIAEDVIEQQAYDKCERFSSKDEWQLYFEGHTSREYFAGWEEHAAAVHGAVTWETCTLRKYLNNEFYNQFGSEEKDRIRLTSLVNSDNQEWHTFGGNNTSDYIFLLSLAEAEKYQSLLTGANWWWLRSPGDRQYKVAHIYPDGEIVHWACIDDVIGSVRPAMYIRLD